LFKIKDILRVANWRKHVNIGLPSKSVISGQSMMEMIQRKKQEEWRDYELEDNPWNFWKCLQWWSETAL